MDSKVKRYDLAGNLLEYGDLILLNNGKGFLINKFDVLFDDIWRSYNTNRMIIKYPDTPEATMYLIDHQISMARYMALISGSCDAIGQPLSPGDSVISYDGDKIETIISGGYENNLYVARCEGMSSTRMGMAFIKITGPLLEKGTV